MGGIVGCIALLRDFTQLLTLGRKKTGKKSKISETTYILFSFTITVMKTLHHQISNFTVKVGYKLKANIKTPNQKIKSKIFTKSLG